MESNLKVSEVKPGVMFKQHGKWYALIDSVIWSSDNVALVEYHEDDGFKSNGVFVKDTGGWTFKGSSTDREMADSMAKLYNKESLNG